MPIPPTNRGLYLAVRALLERHASNDRALEPYLLALWSLASERQHQPAIPIDDFVRLLDDAFTAPVSAFGQAMRALSDDGTQLDRFAGWEQTILRQIRDLREMDAAGTLDDEQRWFGVDAPRGACWYNFDPAGYLEAATEGTFGGWEPEDGGRMLVPGPVAVLGEDGRITSVDPSEIDSPTYALDAVSWDAFADFLQSGQWYE